MQVGIDIDDQGHSQGTQRWHLPPFVSGKIVDLVVLILGKYHIKAGDKTILITDPAYARRLFLVARVLHMRL